MDARSKYVWDSSAGLLHGLFVSGSREFFQVLRSLFCYHIGAQMSAQMSESTTRENTMQVIYIRRDTLDGVMHSQ